MTLTTTSNAVLSGTSTTISVSQNVTESTSYDWTRFKFEVVALDAVSYRGSAKYGQNTSTACEGSWAAVVTNIRACTVEFEGRRNVFNSSTLSASNTSLTYSTLNLTFKAGASVRFNVRAWLDRDGDGQIDPYEPMSDTSLISVFDVSKAKAFIDFEVDPPSYTASSITSWVSTNSSAVKTYGSIGLMDPSLFHVRLLRCTETTCTPGANSGSYVPHPQLARYEYSIDGSFSEGTWLLIQLIYYPYVGEEYVVDEQRFNYSGSTLSTIETAVSAPAGIQQFTYPSTFGSWKAQSDFAANSLAKEFTYSAILKDKSGKPLANKEAFVYVDLKGVAQVLDGNKNTYIPGTVYADGSRLASVARDQVILRRVTDANGAIAVKFTNPNPSFRDVIELNVLSDGHFASDLAERSPKTVITWGLDTSRKVALSFPTYRPGADGSLAMTVTVTNQYGELVPDERVVFDAADPLLLSATTATLSSVGTASVNITLSQLQVGLGSGALTASVVAKDGTISSTSAPIFWNAKRTLWSSAAGVEAGPVNYAGGAGSLTIDMPEVVPAGKSVTATVTLLDAQGWEVDTPSNSITISETGAGYVSGTYLDTSETGKATFGYVAAVGDIGQTAVITAKYVGADGVAITSTKTVTVGKLEATVKATGRLITISAINSSKTQTALTVSDNGVLKFSGYVMGKRSWKATPGRHVVVVTYGKVVLKRSVVYVK
jgi:hypothetical protein